MKLENGDHAEQILKAKRVAYSAYGSVMQLNGLPLEKARVIAKCEDCSRIEETTLDDDGEFRIRGLIPGSAYKIYVSSPLIERTVPNAVTAFITDEDSKGFKFLAMMQSRYMEVSGTVSFEGEDTKMLFKEDPKALVELYDEDDMEKPLTTWQLSLSRYFQFSFLERKRYIVRVVPTRGPHDKRYEPIVFKVDESKNF